MFGMTHPIVRPKKQLGQHFLIDENVAQQIVQYALEGSNNILEIGPGMGVLTQYLLTRSDIHFKAIEIDAEASHYLHTTFPTLDLITGDFLHTDLNSFFPNEPFTIVGNYPYNISSQILFRVLQYRQQIPLCVGMFQREVARRICSPSGNKDYGILSVLLQAYYDTEYLFEVDKSLFNPPPQVQSAVIVLRRHKNYTLPCDETFFMKVVKQAFSCRRKQLRNALKPLITDSTLLRDDFFSLRAEALSVDDFIGLTSRLSEQC